MTLVMSMLQRKGLGVLNRTLSMMLLIGSNRMRSRVSASRRWSTRSGARRGTRGATRVLVLDVTGEIAEKALAHFVE